LDVVLAVATLGVVWFGIFIADAGVQQGKSPTLGWLIALAGFRPGRCCFYRP
jgi:hypothetical protein